jgi:HK97 family phage major capsid protein
MDMSEINKLFDKLESKFDDVAEKYAEQVKLNGEASSETKSALENLGNEQKSLANRLLEMEQKAEALGEGNNDPEYKSEGTQFIECDSYNRYVSGDSTKARFEVKNTVVGSDATVAPDRKPGIVPGASQILTLENLIPALPTTSNAIEYTKETAFTNNAAEVAEGGQKPESSITFSLETMPIATVAHWIRISRQLANDNAALAAYIDGRMRYGVNRKVETQLAVGNGTSPNIEGFLNSGNFTAHGYLSGALGSVLPKLVLIRKMIADLYLAGYIADSIILNPANWADIEIELFTTAANTVRVSVNAAGQPTLFGLPITQSVGVPADQVAVAAMREACTAHTREGMVVEMSDSDEDNFQKNLITLRAERRLALTVEVPAAIRAGDLTPPVS